MTAPAAARPFLIRLTDGRIWSGAEFTPGGFVCIYHPDECNVCTIAVSIDGLLADRKPGDPLYGASLVDPRDQEQGRATPRAMVTPSTDPT